MLEFTMPVGAKGYYYVTVIGSVYAQLGLGLDTEAGTGPLPFTLGAFIGTPSAYPGSDLTKYTLLHGGEDFYADTHFVAGNRVKANPHTGKMSLFIDYLDTAPTGAPWSMAIYKVTAEPINSITSKPDSVAGYFS